MDQLKKQPQQSRLTCTLKLFLPTWTFFNDFAAILRLEFRVFNDGNEPTAFHPVHPAENTSSLWRVLINPRGNLELLEKSLIGRAATEFGELPDIERGKFEAGETGTMLLRMARRRIRVMTDQGSLSGNPLFQCRIRISGAAVPDKVIWESSQCRLRD